MENIDYQRVDLISRAVAPATDLPYCVRTCGHISGQAQHTTLGTYNDDAMLTVFLSGRGFYRRAGEEIVVGPGMVGLVLPGPDVGMLLADESDPYDHFYCRFAGAEALRAASRIVAERGGAPFADATQWSEVADVLLRMDALHLPSRSGVERVHVCDALLAQALAILDAPATNARGVTPERLRRYMHDHVADPVDLATMARYFAVSKPHLCRLSRRLLGQTILSEWMAIKLAWAKLLLSDPTFSVADVSRRIGYEDALYFSRLFRRHVGCSPSAWRQV